MVARGDDYAAARRHHQAFLREYGLSAAHVDSRQLAMIKALSAIFSYNYPETVQRIFVINAPFVFSALFGVIKQFLHPVTVSKLQVCGGDYASTLKANGVTLDGGAIPARPKRPSWVATMAKLREHHEEALLTRNYLPDGDAAAMRRHGLL